MGYDRLGSVPTQFQGIDFPPITSGVDPDRSPWIRIRIRNLDPDPGGKKRPTNKKKKYKKNSFFESPGCSLLKAECFSCSLDKSKLQFLIKKDKKNPAVFFYFQFLVIKTLDLDPDPQLCP